MKKIVVVLLVLAASLVLYSCGQKGAVGKPVNYEYQLKIDDNEWTRYLAEVYGGASITSDESTEEMSKLLSQISNTISERLAVRGIKNAQIEIQPNSQILVKVQSAEKQDLMDLAISRPGKFDLMMVDDEFMKSTGAPLSKDNFLAISNTSVIKKALPENEAWHKADIKNGAEAEIGWFVLGQSKISEKDFADAKIAKGKDNYTINIGLKTKPSKKFAEYSTKVVGSRLATVVDDEVISVQNIAAPIADGKITINTMLSDAEATYISMIIKSERLPVKLVIVKSSAVEVK